MEYMKLGRDFEIDLYKLVVENIIDESDFDNAVVPMLDTTYDIMRFDVIYLDEIWDKNEIK